MTNAEYLAKYRERNARHVYRYLAEHPCIVCGETDPVVLDLDHHGDKSSGVSELVRTARSLKVIDAEITKCQVLCANCHRRKTMRERGQWRYRIFDEMLYSETA